jgi:hypothetical protein
MFLKKVRLNVDASEGANNSTKVETMIPLLPHSIPRERKQKWNGPGRYRVSAMFQ